MFSRILAGVTGWVKAHKPFGFQFEDRGSHFCVFLRTWREEDFYHVALDVIDHYYGDASSKLIFLGQLICAIGSRASPVSISAGSHTFIEC